MSARISRIQKSWFSLVGASVLTVLFCVPARATLIDSTKTAQLQFDLSRPAFTCGFVVDATGTVVCSQDISLTPPFDNMLFHLNFALTNDLDAGESFSIQAFDASGMAVSQPTSVGGPSGGALEGSFFGPQPVGLFDRLNTYGGYLQISNVVGSFELTGFWVLAHQAFGPVLSSGWIASESIQIVSAVPEPTSYALILIGLCVVAFASLCQRANVAIDSTRTHAQLR